MRNIRSSERYCRSPGKTQSLLNRLEKPGRRIVRQFHFKALRGRLGVGPCRARGGAGVNGDDSFARNDLERVREVLLCTRRLIQLEQLLIDQRKRRSVSCRQCAGMCATLQQKLNLIVDSRRDRYSLNIRSRGQHRIHRIRVTKQIAPRREKEGHHD